ncbi:MAG: N-acetylglucosamine-6-phosphate deacetylase, partial [Bryobacteraceae bacterium]
MAHLAILAKRALTPTEEIHEAVVLIEGGQIVSASTRADSRVPPDARRIDAGDATIVPGFVDLHVHGAGGHDVMEATPSALETVSRALAHGGTTSFLATTVTADPERICKSVAGIATVIAAQAGALGRGIPRSEILGIHLEGPFISRVRRGVHPEPWIAQAAPGLLRRFLEAAQGKVRILTLAPELPGALELVDIARAAGLIVSLGHTDATYEQALAAIARGATHAAHVFNAMRPFSHRETGVIGAILTSPEVKAELIADGVHVDAAAMRVLLAAKGANGVDLV